MTNFFTLNDFTFRLRDVRGVYKIVARDPSIGFSFGVVFRDSKVVSFDYKREDEAIAVQQKLMEALEEDAE